MKIKLHSQIKEKLQTLITFTSYIGAVFSYKGLGVMIVGVLLIIGSPQASADLETYKEELRGIGIADNILDTDQPLYRNDVVRMLSTIECNDCINPDQETIDKYNAERWKKFVTLPGNNFDDVLWDNYVRKNQSYYYCVAQAADKGIINGYPREVSPFCPGKFCGSNLVKQGEMIQIIFNIKKHDTKSSYTIDRKDVQSWLRKQATTSAAFKNFTLTDIETIASGLKLCDQKKCPIQNAEQFDVYTKYCTRNLSSCSMVDFDFVKQGQRPAAELNMLMKEGIINIIQANAIKPYDLATSTQLIQYLSTLNAGVQCDFDNDYDKDGIVNHKDNCPLTRNTSQKNQDKDEYGDICDDDIDGDGFLNPIASVDDKGFFDIQKYLNTTGTFDNCPGIFNSSQADLNKNGLGDGCENIGLQGSGLAITVKTDGSLIAPSQVTLTAINSGYDCGEKYYWNLGNGQTKQGKTILGDYPEAGLYEVGVIDCQDAMAYTTLQIQGSGYKDNVGFQIIPNPLWGMNKLITTVQPIIQGKCDTIGWSIDQSLQTSIISRGSESVKINLDTPGYHTIQAYCYGGNVIKAISQANVVVGSSIFKSQMSSYLEADNLRPFIGDAVKLRTELLGVQVSQIKSVKWDFGDDTSLDGKSLNTIHIYLVPGVHIIRQTITTVSGEIMLNIIQLDVQSKVTALQDGFKADLKINPFIGFTKDLFTFELIPNNIQKVKSLIWSYGDGQGINTDSNGTKQTHNYSEAGSYAVGVVALLQDGTQASFGGIVTVNFYDICTTLLDKNNKTLKCDMDKDNIPDICDTDIDGDGVLNSLGIIQTETKDCSIIPVKINNPEPGKDNCPFIPNKDQKNRDNDSQGDNCDPAPDTKEDQQDNDSDNDGIPDHLDNLPSIPLNPNVIASTKQSPLDEDGQIINNCTSCPCGFTQTLSPVAAGDTIYSTLKYDGGIIKSNYFQVK